jgi:predicted dehydrogenase
MLVREAIDKSRFGELTVGASVTKYYRTQEYYTGSSWHGTWKIDGGGAVINQGIHSIDLLLWFMGPVASVQAIADTIGHKGLEVEDAATAIVRFVNGALGTIQCTTTTYPGYKQRTEVGGMEGSAVLVMDNLESWRFKEETEEDERIRKKYADVKMTGGGASDPADVDFTGHLRQMDDLADALEKGGSPLVTGVEARKAVELVHAIYRSAREGKTVNLKR